MADQPPQRRWVRVFVVGPFAFDIEIDVQVAQFAFSVRSTGYVQAPQCYIPATFITAIAEIPAPGSPHPAPFRLDQMQMAGQA